MGSDALRRARNLVLSAALGTLGAAFAQVDGTLRIDPTDVLGDVGPYVFGVNFGPYSAVPFELYPLLEGAGIDVLRFPGGHWGDANPIQRYQLDTLQALAGLMGATASVQVRLRGGTPEAAADLVRYANVERGYGVRHWHVGNEPSLYGDGYTVDDLNRAWRPIAEAMRAVDPALLLVGPEPHQWTGLPGRDPVDPLGREWVRGFLEANGDLIDVVAVHRYPFPRSPADPATTFDDLRRDTLEWHGLVPRLRALAEEVTGRDDLRYAVTEANSHWSATIGGEATNDSFANALWWADVLGTLIRDGAYMVNYFDLHSSDSRGGWGLLGNAGPRPTFHVYTLYAGLGDRLVAVAADALYVSATAALRSDGALTLVATNLGDDARRLTLDVVGAARATLLEARLLDAHHAAVPVDDPRTEGGAVLVLPPRSATFLALERPGTQP